MPFPPNETQIPALSSSPQSIRIDRSSSPARNRNRSPSTSVDRDRAHSNSPSHARHSPTMSRGTHYNPLDPETRERQRTMDVDMAMHLSRARRESVSTSPVLSPLAIHPSHPRPFESHQSHPHLSKPADSHDTFFPTLSVQEEHDLEVARQGPSDADESELLGADPTTYRPTRTPTPENSLHIMPHLSQAHDPDLLVSLNAPGIPFNAPPSTTSDRDGGLPMYQPPTTGDRLSFRFGLMEEYARSEKSRLGLTSPTAEHAPHLRKRPSVAIDIEAGPSGAGKPLHDEFTLPAPRPLRERKLSQSNGPRRQGGKMALFEAATPGAPPPSLTLRAPHLSGPALASSARSSFENVPPVNTIPASGLGGGEASVGHDRPYRFSFYSNALSATIHRTGRVSRSFSGERGRGRMGKGQHARGQHRLIWGIKV
ncbi:hypothetical protein OF83DRAFT_670967 [Amylostereum chailletii]|nr:hypothetical protein OF83DRAFT_670967 [Amylostereum chailletii]